MTNNNLSFKIILVVLCGTLLYFPLFSTLDFLPFRMWDEARPAVHAYEMIQSQNYLVTTYDGEVDMWYTKPPLLVWLQVISVKFIGYNELAIRLPSALAALFSCLLIIGFLYKNTQSLLLGCVSAVVLVTTDAYTSVHGSRTGDVDVLLTFFLLLSSFSIFNYVEFQKKKYAYLFFIGLTGAVLSKGIGGLFFMPALLVYILLQKQLKQVLLEKHFYFASSIFLLFAGGFYVAREIITPGYLQAVWDNEMIGRYGYTIEGHEHDFFFYINRILALNHPVWLFLFPVGLLMGLFNKDMKTRKIIVLCGVIILQYLLMISWSKTKPDWYDIPLYPIWAVVIGAGIYGVCKILTDIQVSRYYTYNFFPFLFLFLIFYTPYSNTYCRVITTKEPKDWDVREYALAYYLRDALHNGNDKIDSVSVYIEGYVGYLKPYGFLLEEQGKHITFADSAMFSVGSIVISHHEHKKMEIENTYTYEVLDSSQYVKLYRVFERK